MKTGIEGPVQVVLISGAAGCKLMEAARVGYGLYQTCVAGYRVSGSWWPSWFAERSFLIMDYSGTALWD